MRRAELALSLLAACGGDARDPRLDIKPKGRVAPADAAAQAAAKLTIHESGVDLAWNGLTLHLGKECGALTAAFDTSSAPRDSLTIVADRDVGYADLIAVMDCAKQRFADILLEDAP